MNEDSSASTPGYRLDWQFQGVNTAYIFKRDERRFSVYFSNTPADVMSTVMNTFVSRPLPDLGAVPRKEFSAKGVSVILITHRLQDLFVVCDRIMVLLTNRVHPCAAPINMQRIRGEFHRLALRT